MSKDYSIRKQIAWSLSSQLIAILFLRNSQLQRDIYQTFFSPIILWIFRKFLQRIKKTFRKFLESSLKKKKKSVAKSYFSNVARFDRISHMRCYVRNGVLRKGARKIHRETPVSETLYQWRDVKKGHWHRCFPANFAKFLRTPFIAEHLQTFASAFSFPLQLY